MGRIFLFEVEAFSEGRQAGLLKVTWLLVRYLMSIWSECENNKQEKNARNRIYVKA